MSDRNMDVWDAISGISSKNATATIVCVGDSNTSPTGVSTGWVEYFRDSLSRWRHRGLGYQGRIQGLGSVSVSGSPTRIPLSSAADCVPYRLGAKLTSSSQFYTFTPPSAVTTTYPANSMQILWVDESGTNANPSYSTDGGSSFTNMGLTSTASNTIKAFTVPAAITSTLIVRGANSAGTAQNLTFAGFNHDLGGEGIIVHNVSSPAHWMSGPGTGGASDVEPLCRTGSSGDPLALLDYLNPDLVVVAFVNDAVAGRTGNITTYWEAAANALKTKCDALSGGCDILFDLYPEVTSDGVTHPYANQNELRTVTRSWATTNSRAYADTYTAFGGSQPVADGLGYFQSDDIHFTLSGHQVRAETLGKKILQTNRSFVRA